jgi:hypothetical protein
MHELLRAVSTLGSATKHLQRYTERHFSSVSKMTRTRQRVEFQHCSSRGTFCKPQRNQRQEQVGEDLSGNQPDELALRLHRASLNSTPHRASSSEEQHCPQASKQQRRQPTSTTSRPFTAINRRPVAARAPPQAPHFESGYPRFLATKEGNTPHKLVTPA